MNPHALWFIVTPIYKPAPGGAAIYTDILARALAEDGVDVVVASEAFTDQPARERIALGRGSVAIDRMFPMRAGRAERDWRSYLAYAVQSLRMLGLPRRLSHALRDTGATRIVVLIHSSLFYNRSVMPWLLERFRRVLPGRTSLVIDVRDYQFPDERRRLLAKFDRIVTSSIGVEEDLRTRAPEIGDRLQWIPMPFDGPGIPTDAEVSAVLTRFGLRRGSYLLNPNGISNDKHFPVMREAARLIRSTPGFEDFVLATIGRNRDWGRADDEAEASGITKYLGMAAHADVLALMRGAAATVVLSDREAISRAAVEAMWVGGTVILPNVAEFRADCRDMICVHVTPEYLCSMVTSLDELKRPCFDFAKHSTASLLPIYRSLETG